MRNIRKGQQSSGKLRSHKHLIYVKEPVRKCYFVIFSIFIFPSFTLTFVKNLTKKLPFLRQIFKAFPEMYNLTKLRDLETLDSKMTVRWIFFEVPTFSLFSDCKLNILIQSIQRKPIFVKGHHFIVKGYQIIKFCEMVELSTEDFKYF